MNGKQKTILMLSAAAICLMVAFPPFEFVNKSRGISNPVGYGFIGDPPRINMDPTGQTLLMKSATINYRQLLLQLAIAGMLSAVALAIAREN